MNIDDDPLFASLAALPPVASSDARAEVLRVHLRELVEAAPEPLLERAVRGVAPLALAAWVVVYLGWAAHEVTYGTEAAQASRGPGG